MNGNLIGKPALRKRVLAGLCASLFVGAAPFAGAAKPAPCACSAGVYSVINLDPEGGAVAFLNEKGQAAVGSFVFGTNAFFDGERVLPIGDLGGGFTVIKGLNNRGVVLAESVDASLPFGNTYPVTWTPGGGLRTIPGALGAVVWAINDRNQVVGQVPAPGITGRAVRFNPDATLLPLGPLPFSLSEASAINGAALAGGYTDAADGSIHATLWNAAGAATDLGTLGGQSAFTVFVNARGEAAGFGNDAPVLGPVLGLPDTVIVGTDVRATLGFIDNAPGQTHTAVAEWGDGCTSPSPLVREAWGRGEVGLQHSFCAPGFQTLVLRVTDSAGRSTETRRQVLVNAPGLAALSGRGTLAGGAAQGVGQRALPLQFTLWAPLGAKPAAASAKAAQAVVALQGPFGFRSDSVSSVAQRRPGAPRGDGPLQRPRRP